jgi:hypothetical protein
MAVYPDDEFSKKPKHVAGCCKQKGICLPMNCQPSEKVRLLRGRNMIMDIFKTFACAFILCMER